MANDANGMEFIYQANTNAVAPQMVVPPNSNPESSSNLRFGGSTNGLNSVSGGWWTPDDTEATRVNLSTDPAFEDGIDGCNADFSEMVDRGYLWKNSDWVDVEFKVIVDCRDLNDHIVLKGPTGHHPSGSPGCCQAYSYGIRFYPGSPFSCSFYKEMTHPSGYVEHNEITNTAVHSRDLMDGPVGLGFCKYKRQVDGVDQVVLEAWVNPDGSGVGWKKFATEIDFNGNGWYENDSDGNGESCGGVQDQFGPWGAPVMILRWDDANSDVRFKNLCARKISPTIDSTNPGTGGGGTGGTTSQITDLCYGVVGAWETIEEIMDSLGHELVSACVSADPLGRYYTTGWQSAQRAPDSNEFYGGYYYELPDLCQAGAYYGPGQDLWQQGYWSNSDSNCVIPGLIEVDNGSSSAFIYHGGPILTNARVYLIFWGAEWTTKVISPTANDITVSVRDKLLGTHKVYFSKLSQYGCNIPTFGGVVFNTLTPVPNHRATETDFRNFLVDCFNRGLLARPSAKNNNYYCIVGPVGNEIITDSGGSAGGWHDFMRPTLIATNPPPNPPPSGGGTTGSTDANGIKWLFASGELIGVPKSRDDPGDFRWSKVIDGIGAGYESTAYATFHGCQGGENGAHWAQKMGGPNHSGTCGGQEDLKESNACCCWYDLGIRATGSIQTQTERPHPSNHDFACPECTMDNIGVEMDEHTLGLKHMLYPITPGGTPDNGGVKLKMWIDTDPFVNGKPAGNWRLILDITDNGQILGNYDMPATQEVEWRNSDTDQTDVYSGNFWVRRLKPGDTNGTGGGGTGGGTGGGGTGGGGENPPGGGGTGGGGGGVPPPGPGTDVTAEITHAVIEVPQVSAITGVIPEWSNIQSATRNISKMIINAQVDPDALSTFGPSGWRRDQPSAYNIGSSPCQFSDSITMVHLYLDGLGVEAYWSDQDARCTVPGRGDTDVGNTFQIVDHGGRIMRNPIINLIFWGAGWGAVASDVSLEDLRVRLPRYRDGLDARTVLPIQIQTPGGTWSDEILFNFDTGASWATDIPLELLSAFGSGPDGVPSENRVEQNINIRIPGISGTFTIPAVIQDKDHYDLLREEPPPIRYPLLRVRDLLQYMSFVFTNIDTTIRLAGVAIPELSRADKITLPDMASRPGTPTSAWQWMHVDFINPDNPSETIDDWFGLNTGDRRLIIKKESVCDAINLTQTLSVDDSDEYDARVNIRFKEANPVVTLNDLKITSRKESASFGRGGVPRNIGGGFEFLSKYSLVLYAPQHRVLIPVTAPAPPVTVVDAPLMNAIIHHVRDLLLQPPDNIYFSKIAQYGGCGTPVFGKAVINTTMPIPTDGKANIIQALDVIENTLENDLLATRGTDWANNFYIVILPLDMDCMSTDAQPIHIGGSYLVSERTVRIPENGGQGNGGTGGIPIPPPEPVYGFFPISLRRSFNSYPGGRCLVNVGGGPEPPPPGGEGTTEHKIYSQTTSNGSVGSHLDGSGYSAGEVCVTNKSKLYNQKISSGTVYLKRHGAGTDVRVRIWDKDGAWKVNLCTILKENIPTSKTAIDWIAAPHEYAMRVGDRIGVQENGSPTDDDWIEVYRNSSSSYDGSNSRRYIKYGSYDIMDGDWTAVLYAL